MCPNVVGASLVEPGGHRQIWGAVTIASQPLPPNLRIREENGPIASMRS